MNVQFDWPADIVDQVTEKAKRQGLTLDAYVLQVVSQENFAENISDEERHRQRVEAIAGIRELRKQVKPDPEGWTIRDYIDYGRR